MNALIVAIALAQAASPAQVMRPLIGFDKEETVALARRIGTFTVSSRQEPDCCTVFMPEHPVLRGRIDSCENAEAGFDVAALVGARRTARLRSAFL